MFNVLSQITLKVKFLRTKSSTAFSLHWWMTTHVFIQKMHYSLTSCQLYFLVPLSSFPAHLLALSHINDNYIQYIVKAYGLNTTIFILVYAESFKSIGMLAYRASFCYAVDLSSLFSCFCKFVFTEFLTTWVCVQIVMCNSRMVMNSIFWSYSTFFACT